MRVATLALSIAALVGGCGDDDSGPTCGDTTCAAGETCCAVCPGDTPTCAIACPAIACADDAGRTPDGSVPDGSVPDARTDPDASAPDISFLEGTWARECVALGGDVYVTFEATFTGHDCTTTTTSYVGACDAASVDEVDHATCTFDVVGSSRCYRYAFDMDSDVTPEGGTPEMRYDFVWPEWDVDLGDGTIGDRISFGDAPGDSPATRPNRIGVGLVRTSGPTPRPALPTWTPPDGEVVPELAPMSRFGEAVAIDGDHAMVSSEYREPDAANPYEDAVYFLERAGSTWAVTQQIRHDAVSGQITDLEIRGTRAVVARLDQAHVYELRAGDWQEAQVITAPSFVANVALSDTRLVVGLPRETVGGSSRAGAVQVYQHDGADFVLEDTLTMAAPRSIDDLGESVDIVDTRIVATKSGGVGVFEHDGSAWAEAPPPAIGFTASHVAMDGPRVMVASWITGTTRMRIFSIASGAWVSEGRFSGFGSLTRWGHNDIDILGDVAVAGSTEDIVSVFRWDGASWTREALTNPKDVQPGDELGGRRSVSGSILLTSHVRLSGTELLVGAPGALGDSGVVYVVTP